MKFGILYNPARIAERTAAMDIVSGVRNNCLAVQQAGYEKPM